MNIEFKYQKHIDLIFHILAHMKVNNASDLYSLEYINKLKLLRSNKDLIVPRDLVEYYNQNFNRLAMLNFLPFYNNDFKEAKYTLLNFTGFNSNDIDTFIKPFLSICENELEFYFSFWENEINSMLEECAYVEKSINDKLKLYRCIFDCYNKSALVLFSLSITRNGRGFNGNDNSFSALIPFPKFPEQIPYSFFILLHEYTHQITDELLKTNINMQDGSHDISENIVMLFDYYLIKSLCEDDVKEYLKWILEISGSADKTITESAFLSFFNIPDSIEKEMSVLLNKIINFQL